jgi:dihydrofolate reductase
MRRLVYYVGTSLDGCIAGPGDEVDFFPFSPEMAAWIGERFPETLPHAYREAKGLLGVPHQRFDTVVMGLGTYRPALEAGTTQPYPHLRQVVVSSSLEDPDPAVEVVRDDPLARVRALKEEDGLDVWLCGGGRLAGTLLAEVDEIVLKRYPVVAGSGRAMVDGPFAPTVFRPTDTVSFDDGALVTWFERV